jgi:hypothetical protein
MLLLAGTVALRRSRILDIKTLEEDPGAAQEFARSKAAARKEGLTGVEFKDIAGLNPILGEVLEVWHRQPPGNYQALLLFKSMRQIEWGSQLCKEPAVQY